MNPSRPPRLLLYSALLAGPFCLLAFVWWYALGARPPAPEKPRLAIDHKRTTGKSKTTANPGTLLAGPGKPSSLPGSWPQFRGSSRDNIARSVRPLAEQWPAAGPPVLWRVALGEGHAGPVILDGRVFLVDYDRERQEDAIRCLSLDDGAEIWRYTYTAEIKRNHGMSRTVPAVQRDRLVAIGPLCQVHGLDSATGKLAWKMDLVEEFGTEVPPWYAGQCPLLDGDRVILAPGGRPLMLAAELATGKILWKTPSALDGMGMTHSSVAAIEFEGKKQYVYCSRQGVVAVSPEDGKPLWTKPDWKIGIANVPSPVWLGDDRIFLSGGYNAGCVLIQLFREGDAIQTREIFRLAAKDFGSDQQTPIWSGGHLFGVAPKPAEMVCLSPSGKRVWSSGAVRFGLGPYLQVNDRLLILDDATGTLHLAKADPSGYTELARADLLSGHDAWAPLAFAEGLLLLRDLTEMVCVDIGL